MECASYLLCGPGRPAPQGASCPHCWEGEAGGGRYLAPGEVSCLRALSAVSVSHLKGSAEKRIRHTFHQVMVKEKLYWLVQHQLGAPRAPEEQRWNKNIKCMLQFSLNLSESRKITTAEWVNAKANNTKIYNILHGIHTVLSLRMVPDVLPLQKEWFQWEVVRLLVCVNWS